MILMAYLSYILAEVRFTFCVACPCKRMLFQFLLDSMKKVGFLKILGTCKSGACVHSCILLLRMVVLQLFYLSGILSVFFCGIVMSHYTWHNVTENSRTTTKHAFATMSFIAETFIFLYVGMDALDIDKWKMTKSR
ncbi:hypothetical protein M758_5G093600 [Ceratodon purpureus]|nr:hypothetical protein M758_5G093600 [Ceratodon purpureus]